MPDSKLLLVNIDAPNPLDIAKEFVGDRVGVLSNFIDIDILAPELHRAANACLRKVAQVDVEHVHRHSANDARGLAVDGNRGASRDASWVAIGIAYGDQSYACWMFRDKRAPIAQGFARLECFDSKNLALQSKDLAPHLRYVHDEDDVLPPKKLARLAMRVSQ